MSTILAHALRTKNGALVGTTGARFMLSWRSDDEEWHQKMLDCVKGEKHLWWNPSSADRTPEFLLSEKSVDSFVQQSQSLGSGIVDGKKTESEEPFSSGSVASKNDLSVSKSEEPFSSGSVASKNALSVSSSFQAKIDPDQSPSYMVVEKLDEQDAEKIWEMYGNADPKMKPKFSYQDLKKTSLQLHREICTPLCIQIALKTFHDQEIPSKEGAENLFFSYLDHLVTPALDATGNIGPLLDLFGAKILSVKQNKFLLSDFTSPQHKEFLYATPKSALDILVEEGVVTRDRRLSRSDICSFTVEKVAEHVLGRIIAQETSSHTPRDLARRANSLRDLTLMQGAVAAAIEIKIEKNIDYLIEFIDEVDDLKLASSIAGRALGSYLLRQGEASAPSVAQQLLENPTSSDFTVALSAVRYLRDEDPGTSIEFAFLNQIKEEISEKVVEGGEVALTARLLAVAYAECLGYQNENSESYEVFDSPEEWLRGLITRCENNNLKSLELCELNFQLGKIFVSK